MTTAVEEKARDLIAEAERQAACIIDTAERKAHAKLEEDEQKRVLKESLQEWLDAKFNKFWKWSIRGVMATLLGVLVTHFLHGKHFG
jgi:hypothetical protein